MKLFLKKLVCQIQCNSFLYSRTQNKLSSKTQSAAIFTSNISLQKQMHFFQLTLHFWQNCMSAEFICKVWCSKPLFFYHACCRHSYLPHTGVKSPTARKSQNQIKYLNLFQQLHSKQPRLQADSTPKSWQELQRPTAKMSTFAESAHLLTSNTQNAFSRKPGEVAVGGGNGELVENGW